MFTLLSWWFIPNHSNTSCQQKEINHHVWETPYGCLTFYRIPWSHLRPKYYHTSCKWRQTLPEGGLATSQPLIFGNGFLCFFHMVCLVFFGLYCHFRHFSISLLNITVKSHKITMKSHKITMKSHKITMKSHKITMKSHKNNMKSQKITMKSHKITMKSQKITMKSKKITW